MQDKHVDLRFMHVNIHDNYVDMQVIYLNKSHVNMFILHFDIIHVACSG